MAVARRYVLEQLPIVRRIGLTLAPRWFTAAPITPPDPLPPELGEVSPEPGSALERLQPVTLEVLDPRERLRRVVLHARFAGSEALEVVHDGDGFAPLFAASERVAIAGGFRYTLRRRGGWPGHPTIRPLAFNADGLEIS